VSPGLRRWAARLRRRQAEGPAPLDVRVVCFREVLHANNTALGYMAQIQQALAGDTRLTSAGVRRLVAGVTTQTHRMIVNLNRMTGDRFLEIAPRFDRLKNEIARMVEATPTPTFKTVGFVVPLREIDASLAELVGQKSAFLGEANRLLPGRVPAAFGTSVDAYREFMAAGGLGDRIAAVLAGVPANSVSGCFEASAQLTQLVESAAVPDEVAAALTEGATALGAEARARLAVRSSALMEGGMEVSFAGQYRSLLNVPVARVVDAFRSVVASKYSPEALAYRMARGFTDPEVAMCCCVMTMVDATAAGVMYSACQIDGRNLSLVQAVRGLGQSAVDGSAAPDSYWVDCRTRSVADRRLGRQAWQIVPSAHEGTLREPVPDGCDGTPILADRQVLEIARLAHDLEPLVASPVDMEWAIDADGRLFILQVRPQPAWTGTRTRRAERPIPGYPLLVGRGAPASPGTACGTVCRVESDLDILRCPPGAVVVTRQASPRLAVLLPTVAAIVADMGEVTGHLATVARELRVPALFATHAATTALAQGALVTVDATNGAVYGGRVAPLLEGARTDAATRPPDPHRDMLASVADLIVPLTLRDRLASSYSARACHTLHDVIRFCHQATIEAMFDLGDQALRRGDPLHRLVSGVPIDCRLFDLGGGLAPVEAGADVSLAQVVCRPMRVLWQGMTDSRVHWNRPRPVSLPGLMSAMVNYNFDQDSRMRPMGEPSYVFVTAEYLSLNSRLGFHFATVDARVGDVVESNYVSFRFVGGSTGIEQRSRRARLLQRILGGAGFETDCRADLLTARLRHQPPGVMDDAIRLLGVLMAYVNHLDMALVSDEAVLDYERAFLAQDYGYAGRTGGA
jgi:pyruvate, water dikinase